MIANKALFLRVGLLIVLGLAAAIGLVLFLGRNRVSQGARYETYFSESVQGLDVGAPVKFRGVTLGQVTAIGLVSAAYIKGQTAELTGKASRLVFVRFIIDPKRVGRVPDSASAIRLGLRARLASSGITGIAYLELDFVDPVKFPALTVPWTPQETYIPSMPSTIAQVQDAAEALLAKINKIDIVHLSNSLQRVLDDLHTTLSTGDAHAALAAATSLLDTVRASVAAADLPGLSADLARTSAAARSTLAGQQTRELLAAGTQAATRLAAVEARLPALLAALQTTLDRADGGLADTLAALAPVLRDAQSAVANLRAASETLRRDPAALLLSAPPPHREVPK
ncbi:MAG: MCE family protein [Rhodospirillales bacterium]|nr:MCE family protein [Rhodospirillales bacterium]MDE2574790.1 MCE family protein [Rhodospirillales bacterium]